MTDLITFKELGLSDAMVASLTKKGFEHPTEIQAQTIPFLLTSDSDLIGKAQTGTGKTAAFGIPLIENNIENAGHVQGLILAPTRELAIQVAEEITSFCDGKKVSVTAIYGGQPIDRQIQRLNRGVDIVVGTPGRVIDHIKRKTLNISKIQTIVLDEADEMLNMGFVEEIEEILKSAPKERKTVLFSATMPSHIERLAKKYMKDYKIIAAKSKQVDKDNIQQLYYEVSRHNKFESLFRIIDVEKGFYGVVFCRTKVDVDEIASKLSGHGCKAEGIHGDLSQAQREKVLQRFKSKKITILVATDVAARGIDVDNLTHVINHALPQDPESYVHRIGRTGRAGKKGIAITLVAPSETRKLYAIERMTGTKIIKKKVPEVAEVIESKKQRIKTDLEAIIKDNSFEKLNDIAGEILASEEDPKVVVAALLKLAFKDELSESNYNRIEASSSRSRSGDRNDDRGNRGDRGDRGGRNNRREFSDRRGGSDDRRGGSDRRVGSDDRRGGGGESRLFIARGKSDQMNPRKLVEFIEKEAGVRQNKIDDVRVMDDFSFFATTTGDAERILDVFQKQSKSSGEKPLVTRAKKRDK